MATVGRNADAISTGAKVVGVNNKHHEAASDGVMEYELKKEKEGGPDVLHRKGRATRFYQYPMRVQLHTQRTKKDKKKAAGQNDDLPPGFVLDPWYLAPPR